MAHNDIQSTMTGLANQFGNLYVHHVQEVKQLLTKTAQAANANKPIERLHLASSEEQHVKAIAQQVERDKLFYKSQINNIAMMRTMQATSGTYMTSSINSALLQAQQLAINLQRSKEQMQKVKALSQIFNVEIPQPIIQSPPPGVHVRRGEGPNLKYIK